MISETMLLKFLGLLGGALAGLTVLVRLGRLLESLETVQGRVALMEAKLTLVAESLARLEGRSE